MQDKMTEPPNTRPEEVLTAAAPSAAVKDISSGSPQEKTPEGAKATPAIPTHLGSLKIREGDAVLLLLLQIYGNTETNRFKAVAKANPHIKNMNRVQEGETIHFPAIPAKARSLEMAKYWVQIAKKGSLEEAYQCLRQVPG